MICDANAAAADAAALRVEFGVDTRKIGIAAALRYENAGAGSVAEQTRRFKNVTQPQP